MIYKIKCKAMKISMCRKVYLLGILSILCFFTGKAQTPTYEMGVTNEQLRDSSLSPFQIYQFDVYLLRTGSTPLELASMQFGLGFDVNVVNGGTLTFGIVPGTSELVAAEQPITFTVGTATQTQVIGGITYRFLNQAARSGPGQGFGTIISNIKASCAAPGTRVGTYRLINSVHFTTNSQMNHVFSTTIGSGRTNTLVAAYVGTTNTTMASNNLGYNSTGTCLTNLILNPSTGCSLVSSPTSERINSIILPLLALLPLIF